MTATAPPPPPGAPAVTIAGIDPTVDPVESWLSLSGYNGVDPIFTVNGSHGCTVFQPYYKLQTETFSVYPLFAPTTNKPGLCGVTQENFPAETSTVCIVCPVGQRISNITDAQFGDLVGNCTSGYRPQHCAANATLVHEVVARQCVGQQGCTIPVDMHDFGPDPCTGVVKSLGVSVECLPQQCDVETENWPQETTAVHVGCNSNDVITDVIEAEFGVVSGNCSSGFSTPGCHSNATLVAEVVKQQCLGKNSCAVSTNVVHYGPDPCTGTVKQLAVRVKCGSQADMDATASLS